MGRNHTSVFIQEGAGGSASKAEEYVVLNVLEFTSDRKRMSVVARQVRRLRRVGFSTTRLEKPRAFYTSFRINLLIFRLNE